MKDCNELTPVEVHKNILFKRDDLFMPFDDIPLSGGKVRQCIMLLDELKDKIKNEYNNTVYTSGSSNSPQGIIVTRVSKYFGFDTKVFTPMNTNIEKNTLMQNIIYQGGKINNQSRLGYEAVMHKFMYNYSKMYTGFVVSFGINVNECRDSILGSVSNQVRNLPDLDYLIVPCGSCIMLSGILLGLKKFNKKVKHVIAVQIAGYDRTDKVRELTNNIDIPYEFLLSKDYAYSKQVHHVIDGVELDPIYEAKAYDYIVKHRPEILNSDNKVCFWLVGNSMPVRKNVYKNVKNVVDPIDSCSYNVKKELLEDW